MSSKEVDVLGEMSERERNIHEDGIYKLHRLGWKVALVNIVDRDDICSMAFAVVIYISGSINTVVMGRLIHGRIYKNSIRK
ncbi:hypothetical protein PHISCL_04135 [Aspergillus sclerotialis]|uniref:Uncharacterized protein n=1 Tax=Aspergillus sclerotialis TaxID=2070753 RepID=A0A3A3A2D6_9EURO|nr:hypothetical protein PHISCL_04135 [Aspergillus sclerotialis]